MLKKINRLAVCVIAAAALSACGGGSGDDEPNAGSGGGDSDGGGGVFQPERFTGSFDAYIAGENGESLEETVSGFSSTDGEASAAFRGDTNTYQFRYPTSASGGCSISGGTDDNELDICSERASGQLVNLCGPNQNASSLPFGVLVRKDAGSTLKEATIEDMAAAAGSAGLDFRPLTCGDTFDTTQQFTLNANGSASYVDGAGTESYTAQELTQLLEAGRTVPNDFQERLRAFEHTDSNGVKTYYLLNYGVSVGTNSEPFEPSLLVQQRPADQPVAFNGSFDFYPANVPGEQFDRTLEANHANGLATVVNRGVATDYELSYPLTESGGCSIEGGSGDTALSVCHERAQGQLMILCQPSQPTTDLPTAVNVRNGATSTLQPATLTELRAAAGASGLAFKDLQCDGNSRPGTLTLNADGSVVATDQPGEPAEMISAATVSDLFDTDGSTFDDSRAGFRAVKHTSAGVTTFYLINYGVPLPGTFDIYAPSLGVQQR